MRSYRLLAGALFAGMVMGGSALGADSNNLVLDEIVVRGQKEAPQQESLSIREVRESPARDMGEALKAVDGVTCVHRGAIANDIVIRGFQKDNINVFLDGVRLHGACPNRMDPPAFHYDFAEVEYVQILKGPYDLANPGSLGGLVEATSKKPKKGLNADLSVTGGSYDSVNTSAVGSFGTDKFDGLLGYAFKYSAVPTSGNGAYITQVYDPLIYPTVTASQRTAAYRPGNIDSTAYSINTGWTKLGYNITENSRTEAGFSFQDAEHVLYPYLRMDADNDKAYRVNWTYRTEKISPLVKELKLQGYWDRVTHLMNDQYRVSSINAMSFRVGGYSMQTNADTDVYGAKLNTTLAVGPGALKTGIDYYNRNWNATNVRMGYTAATPYLPLSMIPDVGIDNLGLFGEYTVPFAEKFKLVAGVRGDLTWTEANAYNGYVNPLNKSTNFQSIGANVQLTYTPITGLETYVGLGRGNRTPDPQELYLNLPGSMASPGSRGNVSLKATVNNQVDVGVKYSQETFYVNGSFFYSALSDYINYYSAAPTFKSYQNIAATMWGYELGSQVSLPYDLFLKGSLSYTWGNNNDYHKPLSEIPPLRGSIGVRYDNNVFFFEATENLSSRQDRVDNNVPVVGPYGRAIYPGLGETPTAGYATTDLKAGFKYKDLSVIGGVSNLFDIQYYNYLSYLRDPFATGVKVPENGRNFYVTVQFKI